MEKLYIYESRNRSSTCLLKEISKIKNIEKEVASVIDKKTAYKWKWRKIENKLS